MPRLCAGCGLSPLARGTLQQTVHKSHHLRFIPAGAGNTRDTTRCVTKHAVYPRWRGEHRPWQRVTSPTFGLSPLARGTHKPGADRQRRRRFIPAGAGNTMTRFLQPVSTPVYPRWRGEHQAGPRRNRTRRGLSPLARGTRVTQAGAAVPQRFIPAGAGNTTNYPRHF